MVSAYQISLVVAAVLCTTVFGELFVFHSVVMPGIAKLDDAGFIRAFQVIDGMVQGNEPQFVAIWIGSVIAIIVSLILSKGSDVLLWIASGLYILGQITTFTINVPFNNRLQKVDVANSHATSLQEHRSRFEGPWNFWNTFRTVLFGLTSIGLSRILMKE